MAKERDATEIAIEGQVFNLGCLLQAIDEVLINRPRRAAPRAPADRFARAVQVPPPLKDD